MFVILSLIVLVAALNIISGLIMLVQDKARAVAVLRTMGATRGAILRIFLITGATIGVSGTFTETSAIMNGTALVGKNSQIFRATLRKLADAE